MHAPEARHLHRHALLDGPGSGSLRDLPGQPVRLQGRHLVDGRDADRVRANGASEPRDVAHARPAQDPEIRPAEAGAAVQVVQGVQRLHLPGAHEGPPEAAQLRGPHEAGFHQLHARLQAHQGLAGRVQGRSCRGGRHRRGWRGKFCSISSQANGFFWNCLTQSGKSGCLQTQNAFFNTYFHELINFCTRYVFR